MPLAGFIDPRSGEKWSLEEGPAFFESSGLCPAEVAQATALGESGPRGVEDPCYLTPSMLYPEHLCRREVWLCRFQDYWIDPRDGWATIQASALHEYLVKKGGSKAWLYEQILPDALLPEGFEGSEDVQRCGTDEKWRVQIYPELWMRGTVDKVSRDWRLVRDFKFPKYPKTWGQRPPPDYGEPNQWGPGQCYEWSYQLSAYKIMIEKAMAAGGKKHTVKNLRVWRGYVGSRDREYTFRELPIVPRTAKQLQDETWNYIEPLLGWLKRGVEEPTKVLQEIPMDGYEQKMFNAKKCSLLCGPSRECMRAVGMEFGF